MSLTYEDSSNEPGGKINYIETTKAIEYSKFNQYYHQNDSWNALLSYNKFRGLGGKLNQFDLDKFYNLCNSNSRLSLAKYLNHLDRIETLNEIERIITTIYVLFNNKEYENLTAVASNLSNSNITQFHNIASIAMFESYEKRENIENISNPFHSEDGQRTIHLSSVFYYGRVGHALNDYIIMSLVAAKYDVNLTLGDWCLPKLLTIDNLQSKQPLPIIRKSPDDFIASYIYSEGNLPLNHDFFSPHVSAKNLPDHGPISKETYLKFVANTLRFRDTYTSIFGNQLNNYAQGRQIVSIHVRMSDGQNRFKTLSPRRIAELITHSEYMRSDKLIYLCSDEPEKLKSAFGDFLVHTHTDIFLDNLPSWAQDLYVLAHSDVIFLSQSSFSVVGAMLNRKKPMVFEQNIEDDRYTLLKDTIIETAEPVLAN
jgi:hypothetical protein